MSTKEYQLFFEYFIATVLKQSNVYPEYCFKRIQIKETTIVYRPISPLLQNYISKVVCSFPQFNVLKIQIQQLPSLHPLFDWFLLNTFSFESPKPIFDSILKQKLECEEGTVTFQISVLSTQSTLDWSVSNVDFFGDNKTLQPINQNGCCVLFRHY